ncbi:hypothetical protein H310_14775 [Aphanomyces invadans]|uniref:Serine-threonine/tyrosine-protein kinase catalytic domain-containing protein n=1 Tax=Aphanomyces invadans TaxID=157072 RepID=A0A024TAW6_9STRA|nr:hypothetical protein H310_14775 [Aphanomyces invadans]ETV90452.1 hypothetical protein H310_14775 [Aphanomyces invadans]|eukprot:XP_008880926.1 hypothetical protein H310_14775 [Aphanomyces invadans]
MAAAPALSMSCNEYGTLDKDALILISDSDYCDEAECVVDQDCYVQTETTFNAIGYFMDYPQHPSGYTKLSFDGGNEEIDLSYFELPNYINELTFINFPTVKLLKDFVWPTQLSKLTFQGVDEIDISSNVHHFLRRLDASSISTWLNSTSVSDTQSFETLPPSLTFLSLAKNDIKELVNLDWRQLSTLSLSDSPALDVISNVSLSSKLENLTLNNLNLVSWTMDKPTYDAVNKLQAATQGKSNGYEAKSLQISSNSCNLTNRATLWGKTTAAVCVLPGTSVTELPPSSTLPPITTGTPTQPSTTTPLPPKTPSNVVITVGIALGAALMLGGSTLHDRDVAVKVLVDSSTKTLDQIKSFSDEMDLMSTCKSPFVVAFLGPGETKQGDLMYFMELMAGGDLRAAVTFSTLPVASSICIR